ncbi:hypothetical protein QTP88_001788 [Uroleucon formosanum]
MFAQSLKVTAEACGLSESTVRRICKEGKDSLDSDQQVASFKSPRKTYKRAKPLTELDDFDADIVRRVVHEFYDRGEYPTAITILTEVKKKCNWEGSVWSMRSLLKNLKFSFKKCNDGRKFLMERNDIVALRCTFLRKMCTLREQNDTRPVVYLDETWINQNHSRTRIWQNAEQTEGLKVPTGKGGRLIICHAGSAKYGFISDSKLIFRANVSSFESDYHTSMNSEVFKNWFINMLNHLEEPSVIVMDNASYHSRLKDNFPKSNSRKAVVEEWLKNKNIEFSPLERLSELRERVKKLIPMYKRYELDEIALEMGHEVIRLPPYHCQYNPIELIWAKVKGEVAKNNNTFKMADVEKLAHAAMDAVTQEDWKKCVAHAEKIQNEDNEKEILRDFIETLTSIIRCILYCSRQDIGIREHKKINSTEDNPNWPCHDVNEGNFLEMIKLLSLENENFKTNFKSLPKNSKYTSPDIQNDLIKAASNLTLRKIVKEVNLGSNIFSLIVDEARDESKIEQMSVCIRYVYDSKIKERFLGFIELNELNAQALCNGLILFLNNTGLDIVGEIIGLLEAVFEFQSVSTLRHYAFFQETNFKIPQHCDTRWVSKYKSIQFFKTHFGSILKVLNTFKESSKKREAAEAKGLILQFAKFEVIVILVCLNEILNIVSCLSINLQSSTLNIGQCTMLIKATKKQISDLREEKKFYELYEQSLIIAQNANISTPSNNDVSSNRMSQGSSRMTDYYITSTTGKRRIFSNDEKKTELKIIFYNILDVICVEMNRRFDENGEFYAVLGVLDKTSKEFLDCETLCKFAKTFPFYRSDEFLIKLKYQCALGKTLFSSSSGLFELLNEVQSYKVGFEELKKVIELIVVIPVSSASAERSFSTMRRVKTYLRSSMKSSRLNNFTLLSIEREISGQFMDNPSAVIDEFAVMKKRRLEFLL